MTVFTAATRAQAQSDRFGPVRRRIQGLLPSTPEVLDYITGCAGAVQMLPARSVLQSEGEGARRARWLLTGWACRYRHLSDGRRQIFDVVLPGEGVGIGLRASPIATTSTVALTRVDLADAGDFTRSGDTEIAHGVVAFLNAAADADERRLLDQVVRLGRMNALERAAHLFLELHRRLTAVGQADSNRFLFPLTQETLADILGLSVVHANRTLQELRRQDLFVIRTGWAYLKDAEGLAALADTPRLRA